MKLSKEKLEYLYIKKGLSISKISKITGKSMSIISRNLKSYGIKARPVGGFFIKGKKVKRKNKNRFYRTTTHLKVEVIKHFYYGLIWGVGRIAKKFNVSERSLVNWMDKRNLKRRTSAETIHIQRKGKKFEEIFVNAKEQKKKISETQRKQYANGERKPARNSGRVKVFKYNSPNQGVVSLYGSWELLMANLLDKYRIDWQYENIKIPYEMENKEHVYIPDFYLPEYDLIIEIKGWFRKRYRYQKRAVVQGKYNWQLLKSKKEVYNFIKLLVKFSENNIQINTVNSGSTNRKNRRNNLHISVTR